MKKLLRDPSIRAVVVDSLVGILAMFAFAGLFELLLHALMWLAT